MTRNVKSLITAIGDNKHLKSYMKYLTRSDGVFAPLFEHDGWEYIAEDDRIFGLVVPDAVIADEKIPYPLIYAFLIESRNFHEHKPRLEAWDTLVNHGVKSRLAHVLSGYLKIEDGSFLKGAYTRWDGSHKIFNDGIGQTNFDPFLKGKYTPADEVFTVTSSLWKTNSNVPRQTLGEEIQWKKFGTETMIKSNYGPQVYSYTIPFENAKALAAHALDLIQRRQ
jgi:hypothetical protein